MFRKEDYKMRAVLFDFDGVVVKSMESHYHGWQKALEEYGIDMSPEELYILEGQGVEEVASQLVRKFNIPAEERSNIIQKKRFYYDKVKKDELYPNFLDVVEWARQMELKIGLVTGGDRERVLKALQAYGIDSYFQVIVTSEDVMHSKPSPEPYLAAAQLLAVEPQDCIVIENAPLGIMSAKTAEMKCIAITTTLPSSFLKRADVVADNFHEVLEALRKLY
jgi:beta-phosphoglucomutase